MTNDTKEVLLSEEHPVETVRNLGKRISEGYKGKNLLMASMLRDSFIFMADLTRAIDTPYRIDFMLASNYGAGTRSSGVVKITKDLDLSLAGYDLLVVENILGSGVVLSCILELLQLRGPKSTRIRILFDKPERHIAQIMAGYVGMHIPGGFTVGYGLDYNETCRDPPYVGILKPHVYDG